jgi:endonuclease/exonuclease/phosphatase family metal-dependent hydrolase
MTTIRVLSYNLHSLKDDQAALAAVVRQIQPDVAILQEAPRRLRWRQKCAALARAFDLVVGGGGLPSLGNLVLTSMRIRVHESWCLRYPLTPGREMRGAVFVRCTLARVPFVVAGSHLSTDPAERPGQAGILKAALSEVDDPVVFGGDLNEGADGPAWRTVADGLVDTATACGRADRPTFSCATPRARIDVVLVDPRWSVLDYQLVDSPLARAASDHFPLVVDLDLPV